MDLRFPNNVRQYFPPAEALERQRTAAEMERLRDLVGSLAEDLNMALCVIEQQGVQVSRVWLRVLRQDVQEAEQEAAAGLPSDPLPGVVISLRAKRRVKRKRRQSEVLADKS